MSTPEEAPATNAPLATATFAERAGRILILKRAIGDMSGWWYVPGGALEPGETLEDGALRELYEEAGLVPTGALQSIGHETIPAYGREFVQTFFTATCEAGAVTLNHEHSAYRWIHPLEYRRGQFSDEILSEAAQSDERVWRILSAVRRILDRYVALRELQSPPLGMDW